ncbi:MAG: fimbrial protein [Betaproteobacteria bacterium]|nr:fimbrial protein [Betaproteobacteria bacterium]
MNRINLLPHREERRKAARKHFAIVAAMTAVLGGAIVLLVHVYNAGQVSEQVSRNDFLKRETEKLDKEIEEIKKLKDEIQALLSRKQVIETLQADRAQTVYLLDQLVRQMPEGVYLRSVSQKGPRISLLGYAQSSARVSTLMRNVESSQWLEAPKLNEIKVAILNGKRVSEFNLDLAIKRAQTSSDKDVAFKKGATTPAAKPGGILGAAAASASAASARNTAPDPNSSTAAAKK